MELITLQKISLTNKIKKNTFNTYSNTNTSKSLSLLNEFMEKAKLI